MNLEIETIVNDFPFYLYYCLFLHLMSQNDCLFCSCSFALLWRSWYILHIDMCKLSTSQTKPSVLQYRRSTTYLTELFRSKSQDD